MLSRQMWRTLEPVHGMIYFAPEAAAAYADAGLDDARAGYFASRSAPMGAVPAEVVIATFFNFNPILVRRAIPRAWELASPAQLLQARLDAADAALRRILGAAVDGPEMAEASALAHTAATAPALSPAGRPLFAGHASLPWPDAPHLVLWHAISLLREYRGDGHIAALVTSGVTGIESLVEHAGTGEVPRAALQQSRAWDDDSWSSAVASLAARGWASPDGSLTDTGLAHRQGVEDLTDQLAMAPWEHLGASSCDRLRSLVRPFSQAVVATGTFGLRPN
ncbi:MAG: SCO6745 family protein [Acidimicrobiales bacterium]